MILWSQCLVVSSCGYGDGSLLLTHRCDWVTVSAAVELWVTLLSVSDAVSDYDCDSADTVVVPASELISISQQLHHQLTSLMVWCSSRLTDTRCCMQLTVSQLNGWQTVMMWGSLCCMQLTVSQLNGWPTVMMWGSLCCMQLTVSQLNGWQTVMMWGSLCCLRHMLAMWPASEIPKSYF